LTLQQQAIANKRKEKDVLKLLMSDFEVTLQDSDDHVKSSEKEFYVRLDGPKDSPYEGVSFSDNYCYRECGL